MYDYKVIRKYVKVLNELNPIFKEAKVAVRFLNMCKINYIRKTLTPDMITSDTQIRYNGKSNYIHVIGEGLHIPYMIPVIDTDSYYIIEDMSCNEIAEWYKYEVMNKIKLSQLKAYKQIELSNKVINYTKENIKTLENTTYLVEDEIL